MSEHTASPSRSAMSSIAMPTTPTHQPKHQPPPNIHDRVHNFNAGPAALPEEVLLQAQSELLNYQNTGMSVMEMSHRSKPFEAIMNSARQNLRKLLAIPDNYDVLFMQGGGTAQFAATAMNLLGGKDSTADHTVDYIVTGSWSELAAAEAKKYTPNVHIVTTNKSSNYTEIESEDKWKFSDNPSYIYYCHNETVNGVEFQSVPTLPSHLSHVPLVADYSSCFCSAPIDIQKYGLIYAGAQKNVGPAGVTIVIIRKDLLNQSIPSTPTILHYKTYADKDSLYNTPPSYAIYITNLVFSWLIRHGGLSAIQHKNHTKNHLLYSYIDQSTLYVAKVHPSCRSSMNVNADIKHAKRDALLKQLVSEAEAAGIVGIAGHRSVGGLRFSIYNAVSIEDVQVLIEFLRRFEEKVVGSAAEQKQ